MGKHESTPKLFAVVIALVVVGVVVWLVTGTNEAPTASWAGADTVNAIVPGQATLKLLAPKLGTHDDIGTWGNNHEWVRYTLPAQDIASLTLWLDGSRTVRWARVVTKSGLPIDDVAAVLPVLGGRVSITEGNLLGKDAQVVGETHGYGNGYAYAIDGKAREIWLIPMTVPVQEVKDAVHGTPAVPLDVGGRGEFPEGMR